jgi:hypothetical protein
LRFSKPPFIKANISRNQEESNNQKIAERIEQIAELQANAATGSENQDAAMAGSPSKTAQVTLYVSNLPIGSDRTTIFELLPADMH